MMTKQQVTANLRAFYLARMDWLALTIVAVIELWTNNGLGLADILLLQAIFGFGIMILEYPSGVLADLTSRRKLLIFSALANVLGVLTFLIADSFALFALAEIIFAFSLASQSGADVAHIYDTYLEIDQKDRADEVLASGKSMIYANIMVMTSVGGFITSIDSRLPFIIAACGYLVIAMSYVKSYEPERIRVDNSSSAIRASFTYLRQASILKLGLIFLFVNVFLRISFWDYLPRMELLGVDTFWYGLLLAGANGIALITSLVIRRSKKLVDFDLTFVGIGMLGLLMFLNRSNLIVVLLAIFLHQVYRGGSQLLVDIKLNEQVDSSIRASIISLIGAGTQGAFFVLTVLINLLELSGVQIHQLNSVLGGVVALLILVLSVKIDKNSQMQDEAYIAEVTGQIQVYQETTLVGD